MFEMFVVGPVATSGLGLIHRCMNCQAVRGPIAPVCSGLGGGCLAAVRQESLDPGQIRRNAALQHR